MARSPSGQIPASFKSRMGEEGTGRSSQIVPANPSTNRPNKLNNTDWNDPDITRKGANGPDQPARPRNFIWTRINCGGLPRVARPRVFAENWRWPKTWQNHHHNWQLSHFPSKPRNFETGNPQGPLASDIQGNPSALTPSASANFQHGRKISDNQEEPI